MAAVNNVFTDLIVRILAAGVVVLRENCIGPRLISSYSDLVAAQQGSTVDIPLNPTVLTRDVAPDSLPVDPAPVTLKTTPLTLDKWKEFSWVITDKEAGELADGSIPRIVRAGVAGLAADVNASIYDLYKGVYNTGLSMPWATNTAVAAAFVTDPTNNPTGLRGFREARAAMNREGVPAIGRQVVLGVDDESNALTLAQFLAADQRGDQGGIVEGQIGRKLAHQFYMDQAVKVHTAGTLASTAAQTVTVNGALAIGATTAVFDGTITASLTVKKGDLFRFNNHSQTYVATADATSTLNALTVLFSPGLKVAVPDNDTPTKFLGSHTANMAFHPDAFAIASRPLMGLGAGNYQSVSDPVSGLTLRAEISRQNRRDYAALDILWGVKEVDVKLASRIASAP